MKEKNREKEKRRLINNLQSCIKGFKIEAEKRFSIMERLAEDLQELTEDGDQLQLPKLILETPKQYQKVEEFLIEKKMFKTYSDYENWRLSVGKVVASGAVERYSKTLLSSTQIDEIARQCLTPKEAPL